MYVFKPKVVSVLGYNTVSVLGYKRNSFSNRRLYPFCDTIGIHNKKIKLKLLLNFYFSKVT